MGEMETAHLQEVAKRGWSRWSIHSLGADRTLIPRIGDAMVRHLEGEGFHYGSFLKELEVEPAFESAREEREWYRSYYLPESRAAFEWLALHADEVLPLKNSTGFNPCKCLGEALMSFATHPPQEWPDEGPYEGEAGYERWCQDCFTHGRALAELSLEEAPEAFLWLRDWFTDLCD